MKAVSEMSLGELAAYVSSYLESKGIQVVLSGGGCVAIYAADRYSSMDLDFIERLHVSRREGAMEKFAEFRRKIEGLSFKQGK
jgi:hypothetical protein